MDPGSQSGGCQIILTTTPHVSYCTDWMTKMPEATISGSSSVKKKRVLPNWMLLNADTTPTVPVNKKINRNPKRRILSRWVDQGKKKKDDGGRFSRACK